VDTELKMNEEQPKSDRAEWQRPQVRKIDAGDAETTVNNVGADIVFS